MKFFSEFKKFLLRGNVVDLAVGVIIGGAFTTIVNSVVNDIFMPLISLAVGNGDLTGLVVVLNGKPATITDADGNLIANPEAITMNWGNLVMAVINFVLIGFILFTIVTFINRAHEIREKRKLAAQEEARRLEEEAKANAPKPVTTEDLLVEIRDLLKKDVKSEKSKE